MATQAQCSPACPALYTVGHSTRSIDEFVGLLDAAGVDCVVDIRSVPRSRTNPQYNADSLPQALRGSGIEYHYIAELGGLRGKSAQVARTVNAWWRNDSFHNYADYAHSEAFARGLAELRALSADQRCAIMCAEAVWWRCHRRIVADYLIQCGHPVYHILSANRIDRAEQSGAARAAPGGKLVYPV